MFELHNPRPWLIGVVHLAPLPGAPRFDAAAGLTTVLETAVRDAQALRRGGCDALLVENFGDAPFHASRVPPETVAAMALALERVGAVAGELPLGLNVLRNDGRSALGLAAASGAAFVRINVLVGAAATDQGLVTGEAALLLRERARLCPGVAILADVHVKHATPLGRETIAEAAAETLERGLADALIVSGQATGAAAARDDLAAVRERLPEASLLVGSGLTPRNASELLSAADGAIVGTWLKDGGRVENPVDEARVRELRSALPRR